VHRRAQRGGVDADGREARHALLLQGLEDAA
jgi:hypothetical protein